MDSKESPSANIGFRNANSNQLLDIPKNLLTESLKKYYDSSEKENILETKENSITKKKLRYKKSILGNNCVTKIDFSAKSPLKRNNVQNKQFQTNFVSNERKPLRETNRNINNRLPIQQKAPNKPKINMPYKPPQKMAPKTNLLANRKLKNKHTSNFYSQNGTKIEKQPFTGKQRQKLHLKQTIPVRNSSNNKSNTSNLTKNLTKIQKIRRESLHERNFSSKIKISKEIDTTVNKAVQKILREEESKANDRKVGAREVIGETFPAELNCNVSRKTIYQGPKLDLSPDQNVILQHVLKGKNVFFTCCAGTGKSVLIREIESELKKKNMSVAITASTGLAAHNLNGRTLHSWSGIGLGKGSAESIVKKIRYNQKTASRWREIRVLVVDEISMIAGEIFEKLDLIAKNLRGNKRPFGGIQLVLCGDFLQLPPVKVDKLTFEASSWSRCIPDNCIFELTEVFRQSDKYFVDMLSQLRRGILSKDTENALKKTCTNVVDKNCTVIYCHRRYVAKRNAQMLRELHSEAQMYEANDSSPSKMPPEALKRIFQTCPIPGKLALKVGAPVILLKNIDETLVNGLSGIVVSFKKEQNDSEMLPVVFFGSLGKKYVLERSDWIIEKGDGSTLARRFQIPLTLSWALTVHKCQGMTLENAAMDLGSVWEPGHFYVAVSRLKSLSGLKLIGNFNKKGVVANAKVLRWMRNKRLLKDQTPAESKTRPNLSPNKNNNQKIDKPIGKAIKKISKPFLPPGKLVKSPLSFLQNRALKDRKRREEMNYSLPLKRVGVKKTVEKRRFTISENDFDFLLGDL